MEIYRITISAMNKLILILAGLFFLAAYQEKETDISNDLLGISIINYDNTLWTYISKDGVRQDIAPPVFQINGQEVKGMFESYETEERSIDKLNVKEYTVKGNLASMPAVNLTLTLRVAPDNSIVRFRYSLASDKDIQLTKPEGKDHINYLQTSLNRYDSFTEINLSEFYELEHSYLPGERILSPSGFDHQISFMGPILVASDERNSLLITYEHGSQLPDRYVEFRPGKDKSIALSAVKGNYVEGQSLKDGYSTLWMNIGVIEGDTDNAAKMHRRHVLEYMSENTFSRKPYIFYNTWNYQERIQAWEGKPYLHEMNRERMLQEIDVAHKLGIEVFVVDAGWFGKTGDWVASSVRFPDDLKEVKAKMDSYGMIMGLWFNSDAAVTSNMLARNRENVLMYNGNAHGPHQVWETEESYPMCLVSPFKEDYANELIRVAKKYDIKYFKWDAFRQYGCNAPGHYHGSEENTPEERAANYSYQLPFAMIEVANKICEAIPGAIVDFDITEGERAVGLAFLEAGKFFAVNNGPYYLSFDDTLFAPGGGMGANVLVFPGLARAVNARHILNYDKWIPSTLFLTHYLPDDPEYSQWINIGSLILGQNGIWGDLPGISEAGVERFGTALSKYKQIRDDITRSHPLRSGRTGGSPEIHEKIADDNGKGAVVIFYNYKNAWNRDPENSFPGEFTYVTEHAVDKTFWTNPDTKVEFDEKGRAVITASFKGPGARIVLFGVE
jgi:alpha-galactosidase